MNNSNVNKKGLRLLIFFALFGVFSFKLANRFDVESIDVKEEVFVETLEECTTCGQEAVEQPVEDSSELVIYNFSEDEVVDITDDIGEVKGFSVDCSAIPINAIDLVRQICTDNNSEPEYEEPNEDGPSGGGIRASDISSFEMVSVTYPIALWLGKYAMESSNREITTTDPAYSSSGEQIDPDYQLKTLSPQQSGELVNKLSSTERKPFDVTGRLTVPGAEEVFDVREGTYGVTSRDEDTPRCACSTEVSKSDFNPGASNLLSSKVGGGYYRQQSPGGDNYDYEIPQECVRGNSITELGSGNRLVCLRLGALIEGLIASIFSIGKWNSCTVGEQVCAINPSTGLEECTIKYEDCIDTENLVVMMSPIFGEVYKCNSEEECTNAFMTNSYLGSLAPSQADRKQEVASTAEDSLMHFVSTPCSAKIEMENGNKRTFNVRCLWDASPILLNYKLQAKDKIPNQENFPQSFEQYWTGVQIALEDSTQKYGL